MEDLGTRQNFPRVASLPTVGVTDNGRVAFNTSDGKFYGVSSGAWGALGSGGGGGSVGPRVIQGVINSNGTIANGATGFTCTRQALGKYRIDFTLPFSGPIVPHLEDYSDGVAAGKHVAAASGSWNDGTNLQVWVSNAASSAYVDSPFSFLIIDGAANAMVANTTPWVPVALNSPFTVFGNGYNTPGYYKDHTGRVHLKGMILNSGGTQPTGTSLFNFPVGFRPAATELFDKLFNGSVGRFDIQPGGNVVLQTAVANNSWIALDGVSFMAADGPYALASTGGGLGGTARGTVPLVPLTLASGYTAYGTGYMTPAFYKDANGRVHLQGLVRTANNQGVGGGGAKIIATLPVGFRPAGTPLDAAHGDDTVKRVDVDASGQIHAMGTTSAGGYISLDGYSFLAADGPYLGEVAQERIVRGQVNGNGTVAAGSGFTVTRIVAGTYRITFTPTFGTPIIPKVNIAGDGVNSDRDVFLGVLGASADWVNDGTGFVIRVVDNSQSAYVDANFFFEAAAASPALAIPDGPPRPLIYRQRGDGSSNFPNQTLTFPSAGTYAVDISASLYCNIGGMQVQQSLFIDGALATDVDGLAVQWWWAVNQAGTHIFVPTYSAVINVATPGAKVVRLIWGGGNDPRADGSDIATVKFQKVM